MPEIIIKHMKEPLPSLRKMNRTIPKEIEAIVAKCCAKERFARFQNVRDVYYRLNEYKHESQKKKGGFLARLFGKK